MKIQTRKYIRILDAQTKLLKKASKLSCRGDNWQKEREQEEKIKDKVAEYEEKLTLISKDITQEEFEEHLSDRMCLSWEDFKEI